MNKLLHFLGYTAGLFVLGVLILTATGRLGPILRGDTGPAGMIPATYISSSSSSLSMPGTIAVTEPTLDPQMTYTENAGIVSVSINQTSTTTATTTTSTTTSSASAYANAPAGTTGGGGVTANATATTCQPGILTKGPQDPARKNYKINCPSGMPGDSYFAAPAITELQNTLACTNAAAGVAMVACPDANNCEKDGMPTMQAPNPFTTCKVTNKLRNATMKTCTADVDCTAAQCDYKQPCKPKPAAPLCCLAQNPTTLTWTPTCRTTATCVVGEMQVGTASTMCSTNCPMAATTLNNQVQCCTAYNATTQSYVGTCRMACGSGESPQGGARNAATCPAECANIAAAMTTPPTTTPPTTTPPTTTPPTTTPPTTTPPTTTPPPASSCPSTAIGQYCKGGNTPVNCPNGCFCRTANGDLVGGVGALEGTCKAS